MKKWISGILLLAVVSCISISCNGKKTLQELLQEERKAIDRFITVNDLVILREYPKDGVFKEKEYFRTEADGLFFQVVDSGNGIRAQVLDDISVRFEYFQYVKKAATGDTTKYDFPYSPTYFETGYMPPLGQPYPFVYGISQTYSSSSSPVCRAWVIPLLYVSEGAVLNMIVPSTIGSYTDYNKVTPVFYGNLRYTRFN